MAPPSGSASYKKKDGTLTISQDSQSVSWIPAASGASGSITLSVAHITSMFYLVWVVVNGLNGSLELN